MTPAQRLREAVNWLNGSTLAGLALARSGRAALNRESDGIWTATHYRGIASRRPFTVGNVIITRHTAAELRRRPRLRAHEVRHATQWALLGPAFVTLYVGAALASWALTGDAARANPFELAAGLEDGGYRTNQRRAASHPMAAHARDRPGEAGVLRRG